ncbi:hypothetical protein BaRGS_00037678 [Batillaria attramentaria]|uniref:GIPC GH2 domain-containing protein n=1 Tax=Batillaria attramentaria TaxID=370345 RepID=A0ABD0J9B6_9CAEN
MEEGVCCLLCILLWALAPEGKSAEPCAVFSFPTLNSSVLTVKINSTLSVPFEIKTTPGCHLNDIVTIRIRMLDPDWNEFGDFCGIRLFSGSCDIPQQANGCGCGNRRHMYQLKKTAEKPEDARDRAIQEIDRLVNLDFHGGSDGTLAREVWNIGRSKNNSYDLWQDLQTHGMGELVDERRVSDIWGVITDAKQKKPFRKTRNFDEMNLSLACVVLDITIACLGLKLTLGQFLQLMLSYICITFQTVCNCDIFSLIK